MSVTIHIACIKLDLPSVFNHLLVAFFLTILLKM